MLLKQCSFDTCTIPVHLPSMNEQECLTSFPCDTEKPSVSGLNINEHSNVTFVQGLFHQGDQRCKGTAGVQCVANSLTAMLMNESK